MPHSKKYTKMLKMKSIYKVLGLFGLLTFASCDLDDVVYDSLTSDKFPETEEQRNSLKASAYSQLQSLLDDWSFWLYAQETTSDVLVFPQRGTDWEDGGKWRVLNRHTWTADIGPVKQMWNDIYKGVARCNQAIETIENGTAGESRDRAIAELRVLRSYYYYLLIDNYGDVPYVDVFASANPKPPKNTRASIWQELVTVVETERQYLYDRNETSATLMTKGAADMLLGKLYLNAKIYKGESSIIQADMDSLISNMNRVIDMGYILEDDRMAPFAYDNENSSENIFTISGDENVEGGLAICMRTFHTLSQATYDTDITPWNGCCFKPDFYERLFADNDGFDDVDDITSVNIEVVDARTAGFLRGQQFDLDGNELSNSNGNLIYTAEIKADIMTEGPLYTNAEIRFSGYRVAKFGAEIGMAQYMNNDFPIFRLADAYLMRAEGTLNGGSGSATTADDDLNIIRAKAGVPDDVATLETLLDERGRELYMEGHRRSDLIRFGKFAAREWWSGATESDPGVHRLVFPIPQDQIDVNPGLTDDPIDL